MIYTFEEIEIEIDGEIYMISGDINYEYESAEADEPFGYWGATPGYSSCAHDIEVISITRATWCDEHGVEHDFAQDLSMLKNLNRGVISYFEQNNSILTEDYETSY